MNRSGLTDTGCLIRFIPAGTKKETKPKDQQTLSRNTLSGEEAKAFYEELFEEEKSHKPETDSSVDRKTRKRKHSKSSEASASRKKQSQLPSTSKLNASLTTKRSEKSGEVLTLSEGRSRSSRTSTDEKRHENSGKCHPRNENQLLCLSQNGDLQLLKKMLRDDSDVDINYRDQYGWTALMCAAVAKQTQVVQFLLTKGASRWLINAEGKSAADLAKEIGAKEVFKILTCSVETKRRSAPSTIQAPKESFYCKTCKSSFSESSEKEHSSSTVHLFNLKLKPKPDPFHIPESNIGYQLMRSSGWDGEKGLGPKGKGAKFPVKTVLKTDRLCLGSEKSQTRKRAKITHFGPNDTDAVSIEHKHTLHRVLSARASSKKERRRREQKDKKWEKNLRQYWDMDCESMEFMKM